MDFMPQPGVFSSLPGFSSHPIFGLINGVNFFIIADKYPFDFLQGSLMIYMSLISPAVLLQCCNLRL